MVADTVKRDFDKEAATWDAPPRVKLAEDVSSAIREQLCPTRDMDILDFGCGTGLISFSLAPLVRSVTGIDTSRGMFDVFEHKARVSAVGNVTVFCLDLTGADVIPGRYHAVVSSMAVHHVKDTRALLAHFHRALLPGGKICVADLDEEDGSFHDNHDGVFHRGFARAELSRLCAEVGFDQVDFTTATHMKKRGADGEEREFGIFLMTALRRE